MSMGLSASPDIWQPYMSIILGSISDISKFSAIVDDPMFYSSEHGPFKIPWTPLKALLHNGLKILHKMCQLFKTETLYMGNTILSKKKVSVSNL